MIADLILGVNIDTDMWIEDLKINQCENIMVLDYDSLEPPYKKGGVTFLSVFNVKSYLEKFDSVNYYKSIYIYPGISKNLKKK